jgi:hypothetical protein
VDFTQPLALSFCCEDLADFTARLLVGGMLVSNFFWGHRGTLLPSRLVDLDG